MVAMKRPKTFIILCVLFVSVLTVYARHLFRERKCANLEWSIGIYEGKSPFELTPVPGITNPVLTGAAITTNRHGFVADPFMVEDPSGWFLFFETYLDRVHDGVIGCAASVDGLHWKYRGIVLTEACHLSYPYVFQHDGVYYMIPESERLNGIRLYKADLFPDTWTYQKTLVQGKYRDSCIIRFHDKWWIFTNGRYGEMNVYFADNLTGPWTEHPGNPVVSRSPSTGRPGGRMIVIDGKLYRYAQDNERGYGKAVLALEVTELTPTTYSERLVTDKHIVGPNGNGWNAGGMHTVDPHLTRDGRWRAYVDGWRFRE